MKLLATWRKFYWYLLPLAPGFFWGLGLVFFGLLCMQYANFSLKNLITALQTWDQKVAYSVFWRIILSYITSQALMHFGATVYTNRHWCWAAVTSMKEKMFLHLQDLDFAFHTSKSSGWIIGILKQWEGAFSKLAVDIHYYSLPTVIDIFLICGFLTQISTPITILFIVISILYFVFVSWFSIYQARERVALRNSANAISGVQVENLVNFDTVKFFAQEIAEQKKFFDRTKYDRIIERKYVDQYLILEYWVAFLLSILLGWSLWIALKSYFSGIMTLGEVASITAFLALLLPRMASLALEWKNITKYLTDVEPYFALLETKNTVPDKPKKNVQEIWDNLGNHTNKHCIQFQEVDFSYNERENLFHNLSLTLESGKSYWFVGRSWVGKTTLIKLLLRFYDVDSGKIIIDWVDISEITKSSLRTRIGIVPQETILFNDTLRHNIIYWRPNASEEELQAALKKSALLDFIHELPKGLDTIVGERGVKLSGGQKQRVGIARVFLENAPIIIFDEATSHLDSESESVIQEAFWDVAKGKTTIVIAHRLSTLRHCDQILVLQDGSIVEQGTHTDLSKESSGLYHHLLELQKMRDIE